MDNLLILKEKAKNEQKQRNQKIKELEEKITQEMKNKGLRVMVEGQTQYELVNTTRTLTSDEKHVDVVKIIMAYMRDYEMPQTKANELTTLIEETQKQKIKTEKLKLVTKPKDITPKLTE